MTYLYYKTSTNTVGNQKPTKETINDWKHLAEKKNWRITQLSNGFYQTECLRPNSEEWIDVTRRETLEDAEIAIDESIDHFGKKIDASSGPRVVKTFN
jgi:hypothetical protein